MTEPINDAIDSAVKCCKCGAAKGACDCWSECGCGWLYEKGGECTNPAHGEETEEQKRARYLNAGYGAFPWA